MNLNYKAIAIGVGMIATGVYIAYGSLPAIKDIRRAFKDLDEELEKAQHPPQPAEEPVVETPPAPEPVVVKPVEEPTPPVVEEETFPEVQYDAPYIDPNYDYPIAEMVNDGDQQYYQINDLSRFIRQTKIDNAMVEMDKRARLMQRLVKELEEVKDSQSRRVLIRKIASLNSLSSNHVGTFRT